MTDVDRAIAMAASVAKAARRVGTPGDQVEWLGRAHASAMAPRLEQLDDDHHPVYLHPGRSLLVLTRDAQVSDALTLATAAVLESRDPTLKIRDDDLKALGPELCELVASVPPPGAEALAERLVTITPQARLAALAERLDHLRHEHLRDERDHWRGLHEEVGAVWLPVAERTHGKLAGRFAHWHRTFVRRL
jgi:hypothetical protein